MIASDGRGADGTYGPWTWIAGFAAAALLVGTMFALSTGFA